MFEVENNCRCTGKLNFIIDKLFNLTNENRVVEFKKKNI